LSPSVNQQVKVQPGDVVGFYQSPDNERNQEVQVDTGYQQEEVWYQIIPRPAQLSHHCTLRVGSDRNLSTSSEHAPILSVTVGKCYLQFSQYHVSCGSFIQ